MEALNEFLTPLLTLLVLIAGAVSALLYGNQKTLRQSNSDLRDLVGDQQQKIGKLEKDVAFLTGEGAAKDQKIEILTDLVTGEQHLTVIEGQLDEQKIALDSHHEESITILGEIRDALQNRND
jgi:hypothetical protein